MLVGAWWDFKLCKYIGIHATEDKKNQNIAKKYFKWQCLAIREKNTGFTGFKIFFFFKILNLKGKNESKEYGKKSSIGSF